MEIKNEMGVVAKFVQEAERAGFRIVDIGTRFPDAIVERDGIEYRTEFELFSKNFKAHCHDVRKCDLIVCWIHDYKDVPLPVLELSNPQWTNNPIRLTHEIEKELFHYDSKLKEKLLYYIDGPYPSRSGWGVPSSRRSINISISKKEKANRKKREMKLSRAIRNGRAISPPQRLPFFGVDVFGKMEEVGISSGILGAIILGYNPRLSKIDDLIEWINHTNVYEWLHKAFPDLSDESPEFNPEYNDNVYYGDGYEPWVKVENDLLFLILSMYFQSYTRSEIADWLESLGY